MEEMSIINPAEVMWAAVIVATLVLLGLVFRAMKAGLLSRQLAWILAGVLVFVPPLGVLVAACVLLYSRINHHREGHVQAH